MRSQFVRLSALLAGGAVIAGGIGLGLANRAQAAADSESKAALTQGFTKGTWDYKAIGPLAFSPSGVLFFADDQGGAIYGVDLGEKPSAAKPYTNVPDLGATLAARLGTTAAGIEIKDVAVSPVSHNVYLSVRKMDGANQDAANPANYALFSVDPAGKVMPVDLASKSFGKGMVTTTDTYKGFRGAGYPRTIGDITYVKGRVLAAAISADAFKSNLVSVPVPFRADGAERYATSIYHISHKKQETASPIQTLTTYRDGDKEYLMAAYICTPVVRFNVEDLKAGQVATGATVAELGNGNLPMAMIAYGKSGQQSLLLNNSRYGILKVNATIAKESGAVNEQSKADRGNGGATVVPGIDPIEALKGVRGYAASETSLVVVKPAGDGLALEAMPLP